MDIPTNQQITNPNFIKYLTKQVTFMWNYRGAPQFPCPQPVSIESKNFHKLKEYEYFVGVKNDGLRYIMFFIIDKNDKKLCILCDRSLNFYTLDIQVEDSMYNGTFFDGEMVKSGDTYTYVIYDAVSLCGNRINSNPFESRLAEIDCCVKTLIDPFKTNCISITTKTFYKISNFKEFLIEEYKNNDKIDGIVFMPNKLPVLTGTQFSLFKWKPADKHTVDFLIKTNGKDLEAYVYHQQELNKFANILYSQPEGKEFIDQFHKLEHKCNDCILECLFNKKFQNFTPVLVRTDKNYPNSLRTVERTLFNAEENITLDEFENI